MDYLIALLLSILLIVVTVLVIRWWKHIAEMNININDFIKLFFTLFLPNIIVNSNFVAEKLGYDRSSVFVIKNGAKLHGALLLVSIIYCVFFYSTFAN